MLVYQRVPEKEDYTVEIRGVESSWISKLLCGAFLTAQENQLQLKAMQLLVPRNKKRRLSLVPSTTSIQSPRTCKRWNPQSLKLNWSQIGPHWVDIGWKEGLKLSELWTLTRATAWEIWEYSWLLKLAVKASLNADRHQSSSETANICLWTALHELFSPKTSTCRWPPAFQSSRWPNAHLSHPHFPTALLHLRHLSSKEFESFIIFMCSAHLLKFQRHFFR